MQKIATTTAPQRLGTHKDFGNELLRAGGIGLGMGAGATALYYLLARARQEKQKAKIAPAGLTAISAGSPLLMPEDPEMFNQEKGASLASTVGGGLLGSLGGGAYGAFTAPTNEKGESDLKTRLRSALRGAAGGGAAGLGLGAAYDHVADAAGRLNPGRMLPDTSLLTGIFGGGEDIVSPGSYGGSAHKAWRNVLGLGALGAGALGGRALVNHTYKEKADQENEDTVEQARKEYFAALSGEDEKAAALLDQSFAQVEKQATTNYRGWLAGPHENSLLNSGYTAMLLAALGGAGVGGTYMYDRTKKLSDSENLRRALESRARMRGTPPTWVDPDELASVKALGATEPKAQKRLGHNPSARG